MKLRTDACARAAGKTFQQRSDPVCIACGHRPCFKLWLGPIVCTITKNTPFARGCSQNISTANISTDQGPIPFDASHPKKAICQVSQSQIQTSRSLPNTDLLDTRTEINLNLHLRQRVYRFEQESSSFNATVVLTQDHCISLDLTKNA